MRVLPGSTHVNVTPTSRYLSVYMVVVGLVRTVQTLFDNVFALSEYVELDLS